MRLLLPALLLLGAATILPAQERADISAETILAGEMPKTLSEFGFFDGSAHRPSAQLIPYTLGMPLFSDYAEKQRFIYLPTGKSVQVEAGSGRLIFPLGTAIIKSFGYAEADGQLHILETRLLLNRADGWTALPYVWRDDGRDADLKLGGKRIEVRFTPPGGAAPQQISYAVPNKNQCKQCHASNNIVQPVGPMLGNMQFADKQAKERLLRGSGYTGGAVMDFARWDEPASAGVDARAASYLYVNCGHCHRPSGSASNSGLFFDRGNYPAANLGIGKRPVAAGRGSGGLEFVIAPGHPEQSILIHRMKSLDPGVAMPELGRASVHGEGLLLLEQWIKEMPEQAGS
ncbi:SO2930 family diheme c-type cytochrome [Sphingorhabdus arenilitoris]|uniref:SO2930 family diheme c-type cytochrome n=1 Tax=Sphingorhabdus arenilitoris TaxID=1490041 RepID=A0ABV8RG96_9SPHN